MVMNVESEDGMPMSIHFNPFEYIRNESDIMSIAGILMKATTPPENSGNSDQFFEQSAEVLLTSIIYLIHYYYRKQDRNWKTFVMLLDATCVYTTKEGAIENRPGGIMDIADRAQKYWKEELGHESDFPGYVAIEKYYHGAAETTSSIVASLDAHCRYMKLECVTELLSEDEIHIAKSFGYSKPDKNSSTGKRILFIVTSEDKRYYDWIPSMVYSLFFDELYHLTAIDPDLHESLPQHLTFLMDEFANVTLPDSFVEKLSTMRSRNMSAVIIVQNLIQLKRKFPKFDMDKDLIGNCAVIEILGAPDMDSCEYLSKHFGTQTIHKASESDAKSFNGQSSRTEDVIQKPLLSAEDIFAMKKDGECAIVVKGTEPLFQTKCRMEKTDFVKLLCRKKPYDPQKRQRLRELARMDQRAQIYCGERAVSEAEKCTKEGVKIIHIVPDDAEYYLAAVRMKKEQQMLLSPENRYILSRNAEKYRKKLEMMKEIDLDEFRMAGSGCVRDDDKAHGDDGKVSDNNGKASDDDGKNSDNNGKACDDDGKTSDDHGKACKDDCKPCDDKTFRIRCITVQSLINEGYSNIQIRSMKPLICDGYGLEELKKMFGTRTKPEEIEKYIRQTKNGA